MDSLSNSIYNYYCAHFSELSFDKQLHFASRLFLWSDDQFGREILAKLRPEVTQEDQPDAALRTVYDQAMSTIHHGSKNAASLRAPYFEKYPELRVLAMTLFRLTFLQTIYDLDARKTFFELFDKQHVEEMLTQLLADKKALAVLSTHAINILYLYSRVVCDDDQLFDPQQFIEIGNTQYNLDNPIELQLYIYLYTHCIIGESKFYARKLPDTHKPVYLQMLSDLETCIGERFDEINLDNKCEFLVCCKLLGQPSGLESRIFDEAARSVSDEGIFLIDRHNGNPQRDNITLDSSEHRNVLYILANRQPSID